MIIITVFKAVHYADVKIESEACLKIKDDISKAVWKERRKQILKIDINKKGKIKYYIHIIILLIIIATGILFTGCANSIHMDAEKCAQIALEYLENKYQTKFGIISIIEYGNGSNRHATVWTYNISEGKEFGYAVLVYPEGTDEDRDGYYDSYNVRSDEYMTELLRPLVKKELDKLLKEMGFNRFICVVDIINQNPSARGFLPDFELPDEDQFSLIELLDNNKVFIDCSIEIPEDEFSDSIEEDITNKFKTLLSDDRIGFDIDAYSEEVYKEREELYREKEELYKSGRGHMLLGVKHISFTVKEED